MISNRLFEELNKHMNHEFLSAHFYLAMAGYCESIDLPGFASFFRVQREEELFHAMRFFTFINEMEGRVRIEELHSPKNDYESILDVFKTAANHEKGVTKRIYALMDIATDEREHATISFLKWFVDEQVEEEALFNTHIKRLQRIEGDPHAVYTMDTELGARTFVPPTVQ